VVAAPVVSPTITPLSEAAKQKLIRDSRDVTDFWQLQAQERYEVTSREYDLEIQLAKEAADQRALYDKDYTDLWQYQARDRYEVASRALDDTVEKTESAADLMKNAFDGFAVGYSQSLTDMLFESRLTFDGVLEAFGRLIVQMVAQKNLVGLSDSFFGLFSGEGRATGGYVSPGKTVRVGEQGPELFTAGGLGGVVTPANRTPGNQSSPASVRINIENRTGTDIQQENVRIIQESPGSIVARLVLKQKMGSRNFRQNLGVSR
jgi:hypothetical protein